MRPSAVRAERAVRAPIISLCLPCLLPQQAAAEQGGTQAAEGMARSVENVEPLQHPFTAGLPEVGVHMQGFVHVQVAGAIVPACAYV